MANNVDIKEVVKHIVNGTLVDNLCRICLLPLGDLCENIFTKICKEDVEYSVADVLEKTCQIKISDDDQCKVCVDCFTTASAAYKLYLTTKRSEEILDFYVDKLEQNIALIDAFETVTTETLYLSLPIIELQTPSYDFNLQGLSQYYILDTSNVTDSDTKSHKRKAIIQESDFQNNKVAKIEKVSDDDEEDLVIVKNGEQTSVFKVLQDGSFLKLETDEQENVSDKLKMLDIGKKKKIRRKRNPMMSKKCSHCPTTYRFISKLKEHMKIEHNIDLFVCKVCKAVMENEVEFQQHIKTHTDVHRCSICNAVFKRRKTIIAHFKRHENMTNMVSMEGTHVCEICGQVLPNEERLKDHYDKKHDKKYTCYYCGRMYRGEMSFEMHIKKHETHMKRQVMNSKEVSLDTEQPSPRASEAPRVTAQDRKRHECDICSRTFVDERSLMWHKRLHTNERPYLCNVCGRGFVSANRRNQHATCAHTAPARRCPLCPALFHLRSMVNSHIKKVHLKAHKRRNHSSKYQNVFWRTEPVPIEELSISIQNDLLEMKTAQDTKATEQTELPQNNKDWDNLYVLCE